MSKGDAKNTILVKKRYVFRWQTYSKIEVINFENKTTATTAVWCSHELCLSFILLLFCQTFIDGILSGCFCKLMRQVVPIERLSCWYIFRLWARQKGQSSTRAAKFVVCCDCPTEWLMNVSVLGLIILTWLHDNH